MHNKNFIFGWPVSWQKSIFKDITPLYICWRALKIVFCHETGQPQVNILLCIWFFIYFINNNIFNTRIMENYWCLYIYTDEPNWPKLGSRDLAQHTSPVFSLVTILCSKRTFLLEFIYGKLQNGWRWIILASASRWIHSSTFYVGFRRSGTVQYFNMVRSLPQTKSSRKHAYIILTPLKPHFYIVKRVYRGIH